jgi:hypothetical protein
MNKFVFYAFIIAVVTLGLVYYKGLTTDAQTVLPFFTQFGLMFQGRNPYSGNFSNYAQ